jgi:hypothetical protein
VAATFIVGYLAFSVPALIAGVTTTKFGLHTTTTLVYSASLTALAAAATGILLFRPGGKPARPAPASRAVMPPGPCTAPPCPQALDPTDGNPAYLCAPKTRATCGVPEAGLGRELRRCARDQQ